MNTCCYGLSLLIVITVCIYEVSSATANDFDARLVPHPDKYFSYVEIYWQGSWYGVHPLLFSRNAASLVCRDHGYDYVCRMKALSKGHNGSMIFNQSPSCTGKEGSLSSCHWEKKSLEHFTEINFDKRVLVKCTDGHDFQLNLTGGAIPSEGAVMVKCDASEDWSLVCAGYQWDIRDCAMICRQLGYKTCTRFSSKPGTNYGQYDVIWEDIKCGYEESHLLDCDNDLYDNCDLERDGVAWMNCGVEMTIMGTETILCGPEHTCRNRCGSFWRVGQGCNCDAICKVFEDCCVDFEELCDGDGSVYTSSRDHIQFSDPIFVMNSRCVEISGTISEEPTSYVLVAKCPSNDPQLGSANQCEHIPADADVLARTPVRDSVGVIFKNVYCAICHGRKVEELSPWNVVKISFDTIRDPLEEFGESGDTYQETYFTPMPNIDEIVRPCPTNSNIRCSIKQSDLNATVIAESTSKCRAYYAPIRMSVLRTMMNFLNPDCFVCTGFYQMIDTPPTGYGYCLQYTDCNCSPIGSIGCRCHRNLVHPPKEVDVGLNFSNLTKFGPAGKQSCFGEGAVYDPFIKKCRVLECPEYFTHLGAACVPSSLLPNGSITARITGDTFNEGFVELLHLGKWYPALTHLFDEGARTVLCRELGLDYEPTYFFPTRNSSFLTEWYAIHINCSGSEPTLNNCNTNFSSGIASNSGSGGAFVSCVDKSKSRLRIVGGRLSSEGFVQISFGNDDARFQNRTQWYYLLGDTDHWDYRDGSVVCRELGLGPCASTDRRQVPSMDTIEYAITRNTYCDKFHDTKLSECLSESVFVSEINKLAWVTCSIEAVVNNISFQLCGSVHTCLDRCGSWDGHCNCDTSCEAFGDCCYDYKELCERTESNLVIRPFPSRLPAEQYSCLSHVIGLPDFFAVVSCPGTWASDIISKLCESGIDAERDDLFLWVPVFDPEGVVYVNRFCAICNGISVENITSFPFVKNEEVYHIDIPKTDLGIPRFCFSNLQQGCHFDNQSWDAHAGRNLASQEQGCGDVYSPIRLKGANSILHFRNKFCAQCHFLFRYSDPTQYCTLDECSVKPFQKTDPCLIKENITMPIFFDIDVSNDVNCEKPGETFNPFKEACTFTGCPEEFFHHAGTCTEGEPPFNASQIVLAKSIHEAHSCIGSVIVNDTRLALDISIFSILTDTLHGPFAVTITARDIWGFMNAYTLIHDVSSANNAFFSHKCAVGVLYLSIEPGNLTTQTSCNSHEVNTLNPTTNEFEILSFEFNPNKSMYVTAMHVSRACFAKLMEPVECRPLSARLGHTREEDFILPSYLFVGTTSPLTASDGYFVCSHRRRSDRLSPALFLVRKCCEVFSEVGITLSLATYTKFSQYLGVTDGYRMQQLSSLLVAYILQLFTADRILESPICKYLAITSHFVFLSHIAWTLLIYYKMYSKFKYRLNQSLVTLRESAVKLGQGLATWGISFTVVFICFFLDRCNCTRGVSIDYGSNGYVCWVGDNTAVIVTVCIPVGLLVFFSLVSTIYSFYIMRKLQSPLQRFKLDEDVIEELKREFGENCWNFVGMVVVAVTGLAAFTTSLSPQSSSPNIFTFAFLVASALYGALLSVVFLMKRDAINLWLDSLCRREHAEVSAPDKDGKNESDCIKNVK